MKMILPTTTTTAAQRGGAFFGAGARAAAAALVQPAAIGACALAVAFAPPRVADALVAQDAAWWAPLLALAGALALQLASCSAGACAAFGAAARTLALGALAAYGAAHAVRAPRLVRAVWYADDAALVPHHPDPLADAAAGQSAVAAGVAVLLLALLLASAFRGAAPQRAAAEGGGGGVGDAIGAGAWLAMLATVLLNADAWDWRPVCALAAALALAGYLCAAPPSAAAARDPWLYLPRALAGLAAALALPAARPI